jgi:hypothetical protein
MAFMISRNITTGEIIIEVSANGEYCSETLTVPQARTAAFLLSGLADYIEKEELLNDTDAD